MKDRTTPPPSEFLPTSAPGLPGGALNHEHFQGRGAGGLSQRPLRVAFLTALPSPYAADLFAAMAEGREIAPRVFYLEDAAPDAYWQSVDLPHYAEVLPGRSISILGGRVHLNGGIIQRLREAAADLYVVCGYAGVTNQVAMRWLHATRRPWIFWGELPGMRPSRGLIRILRWLAQRPAVRWPHAIAAIDGRAMAVYRRLAPTGTPVVMMPYYCDLTTLLAIERNEPVRPGVRFLYCGQFIERKGVDLLIGSFCRIAEDFPYATLTLVGEGPWRTRLTAQIPNRLRSRVTVDTFRQIPDLPASFAEADAFVLPSRHDGWGVVVNQALAAGLPIVCSDAVGAATELVTPDVNGLIVGAGDAVALEGALRRLAASPDLCRAWGRVSRARASEWTLQRGAQRFADICRLVLTKKP